MKNFKNFPTVFMLFILGLAGCQNTSPSKPIFTKNNNVIHRSIELSQTTKAILVETQISASLSEIMVVGQGFQHSNDTIRLNSYDPVDTFFVCNDHKTNQQQLIIATRSVGSGSYINLYAIAFNNNNNFSPINILPLPTPSNNKQYMGHDKIWVSDDKLYHSYPLYKATDSNSSPTGGTQTVQYHLLKEETSYQLKPQTIAP